jgi:hypothetical protein
MSILSEQLIKLLLVKNELMSQTLLHCVTRSIDHAHVFEHEMMRDGTIAYKLSSHPSNNKLDPLLGREGVIVYEHTSHSSNIKALK